MKNRILNSLCCAASLLIPFTSSAQSSFPARLVDQSVLLDLTSHEQSIIAVGERGHVLTSADGVTFEQVVTPTLSTLTAVTSAGNRLWAVGHDAIILYSFDGGSTWDIQNYQPGLQKPFMDVLFFDDEHGIAVGAYGIFYRTVDGGVNWKAELHAEFLHPDDQLYLEEIREEDEEFYLEELNAISPHLNRLSMAGDKLLLAGEAGLLAYSDDQGRNWKRYEVDYEGSFFDIGPSAGNRLMAVGLRGNAFAYDEESSVWQPLPSCTQASLNSIIALQNGNTLIVGNNGTLLEVVDEQAAIANPDECNPSSIKVVQTEDKKAVLNALEKQDQVIAVTAGGLTTLERE